MGKQVDAPDAVWRTLTFAWATFFILLGGVNVYVIYHYTTDQWVNFKLFGTLSMLLVFCVAQAVYLGRYITPKKDDSDDKQIQ